METNDLNQPAPWGKTLLALCPILLLSLFDLLALLPAAFFQNAHNAVFGIGLLITIAGLLLAAMLVGWIKGFPRWVFPYWGFVLLICHYLYTFSGTMFDQPFEGDLRVWMPLVVTMLAGLLWTRSLRPLSTLLKAVWKDWTLLSFAFYGTLPLFCFAAYDETHNEMIIRTVILLILATGAVFYMRVNSPWHRFASLVGGFSISWLALMIHLSMYWNGRQDYWMDKPGTWIGTFNWTSPFGANLMLFLVAPVSIELLRRVVTSQRLIRPPLSKQGGTGKR